MRTAIVYHFLIEANLMACLAIALMMMARRLRGKLGSRALTFGGGLIAVRLLCPLALCFGRHLRRFGGCAHRRHCGMLWRGKRLIDFHGFVWYTECSY